MTTSPAPPGPVSDVDDAVPQTPPAAGRSGVPRPVPSWVDATVARATGAIGGAWGRRAAAPRNTFWTPVRVLLALAAFTLLLGFGEKYPCSDGNWTGSKQYTHVCYSDIVPLWSDEGLDKGEVPYRDHPVEYPVLIGGFMWVSEKATNGWQSVASHGILPGSSDLQVFAFISCAGLALFGMLMVRATAGAAGIRPYDAGIAALSPLLVFHAFSNWDLIAMAFASCALWAWARGRPAVAGVMIGLGAAAKLYPALLLLPLAILAIRTRKFRPVITAGVWAVIGWLAVNLPVALPWYDGWKTFYTFNEQRPAEASTVWFIGHYIDQLGFSPGFSSAIVPNTPVAIAVILALAAVAAIGLYAPVKPRVAQLAFLSVLAFLLTTKVWSPQYSLWLVPLLALARPRWRSAIVWQFSEIVVWILTLLWLLDGIDPNRAIEYPTLMGALIVRDVILLFLAGFIIREMWRPELDVVRTDGDGVVVLDDPGGGVFDGAPDYPVLLLRPNRPLPFDPDGDRDTASSGGSRRGREAGPDPDEGSFADVRGPRPNGSIAR